MNAKTRTLTSFLLATPRRCQASFRSDLKSAMIAARNPQSAVSENALAIAHVTQHFLHSPLVRRVTEIAVALAVRRKQLRHLQPLHLEDAHNVVPFNFGDISFVVRSVLPGCGPGRCCSFWFHPFSIAPLATPDSMPRLRKAAGFDRNQETETATASRSGSCEALVALPRSSRCSRITTPATVAKHASHGKIGESQNSLTPTRNAANHPSVSPSPSPKAALRSCVHPSGNAHRL